MECISSVSRKVSHNITFCSNFNTALKQVAHAIGQIGFASYPESENHPMFVRPASK